MATWLQFASVLSPIVAIGAAWVAFLSFRLNADSLRERMLDRRLAVHADLHQALTNILREAKFSDETLWLLIKAKQSARFLFPEEIGSYIQTVIEHGSKIRRYQEELRDLPVGEGRSEIVQKEYEHLTWLTDQISIFSVRFEKYLLFKR